MPPQDATCQHFLPFRRKTELAARRPVNPSSVTVTTSSHRPRRRAALPRRSRSRQWAGAWPGSTRPRRYWPPTRCRPTVSCARSCTASSTCSPGPGRAVWGWPSRSRPTTRTRTPRRWPPISATVDGLWCTRAPPAEIPTRSLPTRTTTPSAPSTTPSGTRCPAPPSTATARSLPGTPTALCSARWRRPRWPPRPGARPAPACSAGPRSSRRRRCSCYRPGCADGPGPRPGCANAWPSPSAAGATPTSCSASSGSAAPGPPDPRSADPGLWVRGQRILVSGSWGQRDRGQRTGVNGSAVRDVRAGAAEPTD